MRERLALKNVTGGQMTTKREMNEHLSVETPEQIKISYSIAGIGSRFYAAFVDIALLIPLIFIGVYVTRRAQLDLDEKFGNWLVAITGIAIFALFWGYYMVFEITTNGQSPGKRALGLRVIKAHGYPINISDSAIRNLVRIIDFLPFFYGAGLVAMLLNKNWQRLGDLAAGTLVVKEDAVASPNPVHPPTVQKSTFVYADWIQPKLVTDAELAAIREYLSRRASLPKLRRSKLAYAIGDPIARKMGDHKRIDYEVFLEEIYALKTNPRGD